MTYIVLNQDKTRKLTVAITVDLILSILFVLLIWLNISLSSSITQIFINRLTLFISIAIVFALVLSIYDIMRSVRTTKSYAITNTKVIEYENSKEVKSFNIQYLKDISVSESFIDKLFGNFTITLNGEFEIYAVKKDNKALNSLQRLGTQTSIYALF